MKDDVPEWAMAEALKVASSYHFKTHGGYLKHSTPELADHIARALIAAERRGIERAADTYREGAGPEDGRWDYFLSAELAIRLIGEKG